MIEFLEFTSKDSKQWDGKLLKFKDACCQQTYSFGEYSRAKNSKLFRALLVDGEQPLVMAQGIVRSTFFGSQILVVRGGPIYQSTNNENTNLKNLRMFLQELIGLYKGRNGGFYLNITMNGERSMGIEIALREAGMRRPFFERDPYLTYVVPIHDDVDQNMKAFDSKWRNQLRRAESLGSTFTWGSDEVMLKSYVQLHNSMCQIKAIQSERLSDEDMADMKRHLGENLQCIIGRHGGQDVCGCVVITTNKKAYYYYAAANEQGRSGYFSNAMLWFLIKKLRQMNVDELDLVGVDPVRNWGGYHFKKGVGGKSLAYVGEWDFSSPYFLKPIMNFALYWKSKLLYR